MPILYFTLKRTGAAVVTLFLVSIFCFLSFSVIRGDPASAILGTAAEGEQVEQVRHEMGFSGGPVPRYLNWLGGFLSGNTGNSLRFRGEPVSALILERLPVSISLAALALFFVLIIAVPLSLVSVRRENGPFDKIIAVCTAAFSGIPHFFLGLLFIWIFGIGLKLFNTGTYIDYRSDFFRFLESLFFPALAVALPNAAVLAKFLRSSLYKELHSVYFRTALGKGADFSTALRRHALRNALVPSITVLGMIIAEIFSGSIIVEQVFAVPGTGRLLITAITSRDYPLIQSLVMYIAFVVIAANTLADFAVRIADPRIRIEGNGRG